MRRVVPILTGAGALLALVVMLVIVAVGPDDGDEAARGVALPFPSGALTVAVEDDRLALASPDLVPGRVERLAATGTAYTRVAVHWNEVAAARPADPADPADPAYNWSRYDAILSDLARRDITPIVVFSQSPAWANGGKDPQWAPELAAYGAFVRAFATRYRGGPNGSVRMYEPWDEPNNPALLLPQWDETVTPARATSPALYAALLARAAGELRAANPQAAVIGVSAAHIEASAPPLGGVGVTDFVQALVPLRPPMDAVAQHLEPQAAPNAPSDAVPAFATLPQLVEELERLAPGAPLLITRVGYATSPGGLTEADQATYMAQAFERLAAVPQVRLAVWHSLQDSPERPDGLLRADGSAKPAWDTFVDGPKSFPSATGP